MLYSQNHYGNNPNILFYSRNTACITSNCSDTINEEIIYTTRTAIYTYIHLYINMEKVFPLPKQISYFIEFLRRKAVSRVNLSFLWL